MHRNSRAAAATLMLLYALAMIERPVHAQRGDDGGIAGGSCPADVNDSGTVDVNDLLSVITAWGACPAPCPPHCLADVSANCAVDVNDLLTIITNWGPCPCPPDGAEPNQSCAAPHLLTTVSGSGAPVSYSNYSVVPTGDLDHYRFYASENCNLCADYLEITVSLTVTASAGSSYALVVRRNSCSPPAWNMLSNPSIAPGTTATITMTWDDNWGSDDSSWIYLEIRQNAPLIAHCQPYVLLYDLIEH